MIPHVQHTGRSVEGGGGEEIDSREIADEEVNLISKEVSWSD
jgi:hypothetical protein